MKKLSVLLFICSFLMLTVSLSQFFLLSKCLLTRVEPSNPPVSPTIDNSSEAAPSTVKDPNEKLADEVPIVPPRKILDEHYENSTFAVVPPDKPITTKYETMMLLVKEFNKNSAIRNQDKFVLAPNYMPIVIRVHNKPQYFKVVLDAWRNNIGINETLLIISHDGLFPEMLELVESIDFCQVKQLIHPHSQHILGNNTFPGDDPNLLPTNDQYKHNRTGRVTALKHHFWWLQNYVWDVLLPDFQGDILWMEEDHVPSFDLYRSIQKLNELRRKHCPTNKCLGTNIQGDGKANAQTRGNPFKAIWKYFTANLGFSWSRDSWEKVKAVGEHFCNFDDYNWDLTISWMGDRGFIPTTYISAEFARVTHLGKCGVHQKKGKNDTATPDCRPQESDLQLIKKKNEIIKSKMTGNWTVINFKEIRKRPSRGYGGWAHPSDHAHCIAQIRR